MSAERIVEVCATLRKIVVSHARSFGFVPKSNSAPERNELFDGSPLKHANIEHLLYRLDEIPKFVAEDRREKAMRWLGFVQGVVCVWYGVPVEELKQLNAIGTILQEEPLG